MLAPVERDFPPESESTSYFRERNYFLVAAAARVAREEQSAAARGEACKSESLAVAGVNAISKITTEPRIPRLSLGESLQMLLNLHIRSMEMLL